MSQQKPKNIVIVGGSLGGLFMGVALKRLRKDFNIRVLERNPTPLLHDQGAGVVAGPEAQQFFTKFDRTRTPLIVTSHQRLYLDKNGNVIDREQKEQQMTSWDLLYHLLRANLDGVESKYADVPAPEENEGSVSYEYGCTVTDVNVPRGTSQSLDISNPITVSITHHSGQTSTVAADLIIAADGPSSKIRQLYLPDIKRTYAGYVAWRGTVPEDKVSPAAKDVFVEKFPFFHTENNQILAYTIPGKYGNLEPGKRLLNWVWYVNYPEDSPEHIDLMTDGDGQRHHITLPAGGVRKDVWAKLKQYADATLPPQFAELVEKTEVPFVQAITDVISPSAIFGSNRVLLIGDALAGLRPHTAMSTSQAAMNAMKLAEAINNIESQGVEALQTWEKEVTESSAKLKSHGVQIGNRSQFGEHPMSDS